MAIELHDCTKHITAIMPSSLCSKDILQWASPTLKTEERSSIDIIITPIALPCGLTLPNRLVKCPMQETLAQPPLYDPPVDTFQNLYTKWAGARYGLIITGQVQVDLRFLSIPGDVVAHKKSLEPGHIETWKKWASIAKSKGTPCVVQLAHPGRMSPAGAGERPKDMQTLCPSSVPVKLGDSFFDKLVGIPVVPLYADLSGPRCTSRNSQSHDASRYRRSR